MEARLTIASQQIVDGVAEGIRIVGKIASVEKSVMPYAIMIGGLFPGVATVLGAIAAAQPYINAVAQYAPTVAAAVDKGAPILDAIREHAPEAIGHMKSVYATIAAADPTLSHVTAGDVTDAMAAEMFKAIFCSNFFTPQDPRFHGIGDVS
jgi:hypothetical protein